MTTLHIQHRVPGPAVRFSDRADAGRRLAEYIAPQHDRDAVVFGLPRGGLPVGRPLASALRCELRPALVRKLPIPSDPEMGFGAVTIDGTLRLNESVVRAFRISPADVARVAEEVRTEIERRATVYPGGWPLPSLEGRSVWLVDDGLATGLTMLAGAQMLRARGPARLLVAVPCSPSDSLARAAPLADELWCLYAQQSRPFAVASFYRDFHDLTDAEVQTALAG